ncbi:MAG: GNAT family N-acetyltransferase [Pirellulales bacterium]
MPTLTLPESLPVCSSNQFAGDAATGWRVYSLPSPSAATVATPAPSAVQARLVAAWRSLLDRSEGGSLELHPEIALGTAEASPRTYELAASESLTGAWQRLALFEEKAIRLPLFAGRKRFPALNGVRLAGELTAHKDELGRPHPADDSHHSDAASLLQAFAQLLDNPTAVRDAILIEDLETHSSLWQALASQTQFAVLPLADPQPRWRLRLADSSAAYWSQFSSKRRYNFRRMQRLLTHECEAIERVEQVEQFLGEAETISLRSWQGRRLGVRVRRDDRTKRYFQRLAQAGCLRSYLLRSAGAPAAFAVGTQWRGRFQLEEIGFDPQFADLSPGAVLLLDLLEDLHNRRRPEVLDFGFGDGAYKQQFGNEQTASGSLLVVSRRRRPRTIAALYSCSQRLEQFARGALHGCGLQPWARRLHRRLGGGASVRS